MLKISSMRHRSVSQPVRWIATALILLLGAVCACSGSEAQKAEIRELHEKQRYAETIESLEALLDRDPDDRELNHLYGVALLATGQAHLAIWPLRHAAEDPERALEDGLLLGRAQLVSGSSYDAIATANRLLEQAPDLLEALMLRIEAEFEQQRNEEALADIDYVLARRPDDPAVLLARVKALLRLEREEEAGEAIAAFRARVGEDPATEDQPGMAASFCAVGAVFDSERGMDPEGVEAEWMRCLEQFPAEPVVVDEAIGFFDRRGDYDRATGILRRAHEKRREYQPFRAQLAQRLERAARSDEAEQILLEGTEQGTVEAWLDLANYYSERGDFPNAKEAMEGGLAQMADPPPLYVFQYVDILIRGEYFDEAEAAISMVEPPTLVSLLRGRLLLERGDARGALASLEEGIRLWPDNSVARQLAAEAAEQLGDFDRAISEYKEATRNDINNWEAIGRFALLNEAQGTDEAVLPLLQRYIRQNPQDPKGYRLQIQIAGRLGMLDVANRGLQVLGGLPGQSGAALTEAATLRAVRSPAAGVQLIEESPFDLTQPRNAEILAVLVENLSKLGRHAEAIGRADDAVAAQPEIAAFHETRGRALWAAGGQAREARQAFQRALELEPERSSALVALAEALASEADVDEAVTLYDRATAADPGNPDAAWAAIQLLATSSRSAEVEPRVEKLLDVHGYHAGAANLLAGRLTERAEDPDRAHELAQRAVRFRGGPEALDTLGRIELERGKPEVAVELLRRSLEARPDSPSARYWLGRALARAGDTENARQELEKALVAGSFPEEEEARAELARLATP